MLTTIQLGDANMQENPNHDIEKDKKAELLRLRIFAAFILVLSLICSYLMFSAEHPMPYKRSPQKTEFKAL